MKTAYPITSAPVTIRLYSNVPFDNTYKHHSLVSELFKYNGTSIYNNTGVDRIAKESFLDRKKDTWNSYYYPRYDLTGEFNFNFSNGLVGSVTLELTYEKTNANYMRVKVGDATHGYEYYYYFITAISQVNADTYNLSLELDVLMTYQDEFLSGVGDIPVFTSRKHCHRYTNDGLMPHCADLKSGEETFAGIKPTLVSSVFKLNYENAQMKKIKDVMWLYICLDTSGLTGELESIIYKCNDKNYPLIMLAIPLNVNTLTYKHTNGSYIETYNHSNLVDAITQLIGNGAVHGAKISPYAPFYIDDNSTTITMDSSRNLTIAGVVTVLAGEDNYHVYQLAIGNNKLWYGDYDDGLTLPPLLKLFRVGCVIVSTQNDTLYKYDEITPTQIGIANTTAPSPLYNRYLDPKLLFNPFKKYKISAQYCTEGSEFFPELLFSEYNTASNGHYFSFDTTSTAYIGDSNFYTKIKASVGTYDNYKYDKIGLACAVNYIMPCGTNALDVFNSTQASSFYTSKVASGVTSGLTIAGGVGSIAMGVGAGILTHGIGVPMTAGLIAGGVTAISSGIAGVATTIKSANSKIEDLKNTPDNVNISGSNFITDECITGDTNGLPYIVVYDVSSVIKENANDYFYNYGYQVARLCYFNTELKYDNNVNNKVDNNLLGRTIFNYVQTNDDITNKIDADIPLIIKQKFNSIFNNGVTLWTFFGFNEIWGSGTYPSNLQQFKRLHNWFMKCVLDNTEYNGETY